MAVTWKKIAYSDQKLDDFGTPDDNTDLNASTSAHGLLLKLDNTATNYMDGTGAWSVPAGGDGGATLTVAETEIFSGTAPTTWTDLDGNATWGSQATLVLIKVYAGAGSYADKYYAFRKNGDTDEFFEELQYPHGCAMGYLVEEASLGVFLVATDTSGVIEWKCGDAKGGVTIDVIAYIA